MSLLAARRGTLAGQSVAGGGGGGGTALETRTWDVDEFDGLVDWYGTQGGTRAFANPGTTAGTEILGAFMSYVFDGAATNALNQATDFCTTPDEDTNHWWTCWFGEDRAVEVTHWGLVGYTDSMPRNFTLQGLTAPGAAWTDIESYAGVGPAAGAWWSDAISDTTQYIALRVRQDGVNSNGQHFLRFRNFEVWGTVYDVSTAGQRIFDCAGPFEWDWSAAGSPASVDVLLVGGGAAGGGNRGGGGGAGEVLEAMGHAVSANVTGSTGEGGATQAVAGGNSTFDTLTADGGGSGGHVTGAGGSGGSGGGGGHSSQPGGSSTASPGLGNPGGAGSSNSAGGGGGAGAAGQDAPDADNGGDGGAGTTIWGRDVAGGGGGGGYTQTGGTGGTGGGGDGQGESGTPVKTAGEPGTGSGGGGGTNNSPVGMPGGHGIVIVRW